MTSPGVTRATRLALVIITAVAAAARFWGLSFGLPHTGARPDEMFIINTALSFLRGDFKPHFYDYPWLYMIVVTLLYLGYFVWGLITGVFHSIADLTASWPLHWEPFFLLNRGLSATAGTATVVVLFWIGRRLWDETTGLVAALFLSLAFVHVRDSHFGTTDVAMTLLVALSAGLLVDAHLEAQRGRPASFGLAGAVGGLATATKYNAVLLAIPAVMSQLLQVLPSSRLAGTLEGGAPSPRLRFDDRLLRFVIPFALALLIGVPFVLLDTQRFLAAMDLLKHSTLTGQGAVPVEAGWMHHLRLSLRYGIGLPLLVTGLAGTLTMLVRTPVIGALLLSFPLAYFVVMASVRNLFIRYAIPLVPFLCLSAAWLITFVVARVASAEPGRRPARWRATLTWLIALAVVAPSAVSVWEFDRILGQTDNRVVVSRWFEQHVPEGSSLLQSGSGYGHAQFDRRMLYVEWRWDNAHLRFTVNERPAEGLPDWIVVQDSPLPSETQPIVKELLTQGYVLTREFVALSLAAEHLYDLQDAFYVPFAGFSGVKRPGPNFSVYRRIGAAFK